MTDPGDNQQAEQQRDVAENASFNSARRHVGAAGFVQRDVLEQIISAGREQISVTRSLRQVIATTRAQLRTVAGGPDTHEAHAHIETLDGIVASSQAQIQTAMDLREAIQHTLEDVRGTPLEEISGTLLNNLSAVVRRQMEQLQELITAALNEAGSPGQVAELQQVSAEARARQVHAEHEQAERELTQLELAGARALERIRELEEAGVTHMAQRAELEDKAEQDHRQIAALEREEQQNLAELGRLEQQETTSKDTRRTLDGRGKRSQAEIDPHEDDLLA